MTQEYQYLAGTLHEALAADERGNALDVEITIAHRRVHLAGQVPTQGRQAAVQRIAQQMLSDFEIRSGIPVLHLAAAEKPEALDG
jgi:osmotically-inducible protein OsmY